MGVEPTPGRPLRILRGARAAENHLLEALAPFVEEVRRDPARARLPVRIAVSSGGLREHLCAALVGRFGAVAGVSVRTLYAFALEIAELAGERAPAADSLLPVWIRRLARDEPALREGFEPFVDGYGLVEAGVADLLDAGFESHHAEAIDEQLVERAGGGALVERARALVRVAARADRELASTPFGHRARLFRRARECVERDPGRALAGRALFVHGFADATGVQADLIETLVRLCGARVVLDHPPDPASEEGAVEDAFSRRFSERLAAAAGGVDVCATPAPRPRIAILRAPGPHAEVRAVAERVRAALDAGTRPERIGVVARSLADYRLPLRLHFGRLGIPFSGLGERGPLSAAGRSLSALLALLARRERTPCERWLDVRVFRGRASGEATAVERADLALLLHERGAARLGDAAGLELPSDGSGDVALPVQRGIDDGGQVARRWLPRPVLERAVAGARALAARLARWPESARLAEHREQLRRLVEDDLHWADDAPARRALDEAILDPRAALPEDFELSRDDFRLLLERSLGSAGTVALGGEGAGVQVLNAMESRARTFERLFVLGLARGAFPRSVTEDPLLPDALRRPLRQVLPDLPVKSEGRDEERYLFAQLLSASPEVTLACPVTDDEGRAQPASPLVERLASGPEAPVPEVVPSLYGLGALRADGESPPRPAHEHALLVGLHGSRRRFSRVLPLALAEAGRVFGGDAARRDPETLAHARAAVLEEIDPPPGRAPELGPYFGFAGPEAGAGRELPYVTGLEAIAQCPWQAFLRRVLRLEMLPDALYALPNVDPRVLGTLVHGVLERVAEPAGAAGRELDAVVREPGVRVAWPAEAQLEALVREAAEAAVRDEGIALPGFASVLALRARERLALARARDWADGAPTVLGAEVLGAVGVRDRGDGERAIRFRVDRVDRADGGLRLTDYKTGRPRERQKTAASRAANHCKRVASGEMLQATAYALAGARHGPARGRYLYLHPDGEGEIGEVEVSGDQAEFAEAFGDAVARVLEVWDRGSFFPRLVDAKGEEPFRCKGCEVKIACLRGDSGARRRLLDWSDAKPAGADPARAAIREAWRLGSKA